MDIGKVANTSQVMTRAHCCDLCAQTHGCKVAVFVPDWQNQSLCELKSGCTAGGSGVTGPAWALFV